MLQKSTNPQVPPFDPTSTNPRKVCWLDKYWKL